MRHASEPVVLESLVIEPVLAEVFRYLGYPAGAVPDDGVQERVRQAIEKARERLRPRAMYAVYDVQAHEQRALRLSGGALFAGTVGDYLGQAERVAVFLATAGAEAAALADEALNRRDTLGGLILNAIGSEIAEATVERLVGALRATIGPHEELTLRYSPGYCGISLSQQRTIFRLLEASRIGVELLPTLIMKPIKSVSGLIGIGPREAVNAYANPCERCPLLDCRMRR